MVPRKRIIKSLRRLKANLQIGKPLNSILKGLWSLRIGDYRVIYQIRNDVLVVSVIRIGHKKKAYY